jgi:hypothetical protein
MAAEILSTRESRKRWFMIIDRKGRSMVDKSDLLHFASKLKMGPDQASQLFDRLDTDNDGFLNEVEWDRIGATLANDGLVRSESHPMFCAYFAMSRLGTLSNERLKEIVDFKGLDSRLLGKPDEMIPLPPNEVAYKPMPAAAMNRAPVDSMHMIPKPPAYRSGPSDVSLPPLPFCPPTLRPRARLPFEVPEGPVQPIKWATQAMDAIHNDRPGSLRYALSSPICDINARVSGGRNGCPFSIGYTLSVARASTFVARALESDRPHAFGGHCRWSNGLVC